MRLYNSVLPTLARFGPTEEATCHFFKASPETAAHILLDCPQLQLETLCKPVAEALQLSSIHAPPTDNPPAFYQFLMLLETKWATCNFHTHSPHSSLETFPPSHIQWQLAVTPLKLLFPEEPP